MGEMELPEKYSDLIELALDALEKCERSPEYEIDMIYWHEPEDGICSVCLAGAVLAQNLGADAQEAISPSRFPRRHRVALRDLDGLRIGEVPSSVGRYDLDRYITPYKVDPDKFKWDMRDFARDLRAEGI